MSGFFLKTLNMSISACYIILAVIVLRFLLMKAPKWINCVLWSLVGLKLILPFSLKSVLSLIPSSETISKAPSSPRPHFESGFNIVDRPVNEYLAGHYFEGVTRPTGHFVDLTEIIASVWLVGILCLLIYTAFSYFRLKNKIGTAVRLYDNIYQSENVGSPFVLGLIKPKIYLPFNIDDESIDHVISHERAHIKRMDHLWKPLSFLIVIFYWYNPLVWLAYVLLCRDIELACDEKVIKMLDRDSKADYSQALLKCSVKRRMIAVCPLAFGEVGVKSRVKSVLNYKKPAFWLVLIAIIVSIAVAVCFLTDPKKDKNNATDSNVTQTPSDGTENLGGNNPTPPTELPDFFKGKDYKILKAEDLVYDDGMYSYVQSASNCPTYVFRSNMVLYVLLDDNTAQPIGLFKEIELSDDNFNMRFRNLVILGGDESHIKDVRKNNKRAWELRCEQADYNELYLLLEQNDGTFYLGYGYYEAAKDIPVPEESGYEIVGNEYINSDNSHIRWLYKLADQKELQDVKIEPVFPVSPKEMYVEYPPDLIVTGYEQSIVALKGTSSWVSKNPDGYETAIDSDSSHPLLVGVDSAIDTMPTVYIIPTIFSSIDPLSVNLQFNDIDSTPVRVIPPNEVKVRCWDVKDRGNTDAESEDLKVNIENGNFYFRLKDGEYIYEVTAVWEGADNYSGKASYCFSSKIRSVQIIKPTTETKVFLDTDNIVAVNLYSKYGTELAATVPDGLLNDYKRWLATFTIGEPLTDIPVPGTNTHMIEVIFANGEKYMFGTDMITIAGKSYYLEFDIRPDSYWDLYDIN